MRTQTFLKAALATTTIVVAVGLLTHHEARERRKQADQAEIERRQQQEVANAIRALVRSHHADATWENSICSPDFLASVLTSELQDALIGSERRPVLISGSLTDAREEAGQQILSFSSSLHCRDARLRVELESNADLKAQVLARRSEGLPYYAIIAEIASVERSGEEGGKSVFLVRGHCVAVLFTGWEGLSLELETSKSANLTDAGARSKNPFVTALAIMVVLWVSIVVAGALFALLRWYSSSRRQPRASN